MTVAERYERLPTTGKLLLILTAVLLPIGLALAWIGDSGIRQANAALEGHKHDQSRAAALAIESLIARNALGLRVAAAGALRNPEQDPCAAAGQALATAPAITRDFALRSTMGEPLCTSGRFIDSNADPLVAPGDIRAWVDPAAHEIDIRVGERALELPRKLGPSKEIQELRNAFGRAIERAEESEHETTSALEGQRRLVREVHHRVKNNLQVVASLLNIHGRSANTPEARAAYAGISRRVSALSIVHRNHFAEMEENRGIAVRPLVSELAAELRAGAPESARKVTIELDLDSLYTTQDVAVAVAFLVTEIVEFAMLRAPENAVEISLRRTSDLTGRLELSSPILVQDAQDDPEKVQFERIVGGLAKQLRSTLERKVGRYSVDLPVFPPA